MKMGRRLSRTIFILPLFGSLPVRIKMVRDAPSSRLAGGPF
jgi:hypothetical protein